MTQVKSKKVLVMGLGRFGGGVGVTKWLVGQGARVTVTDLKTADELSSSVNELAGLRAPTLPGRSPDRSVGIDFILGKHDSSSIKNSDLIVVNPAVKPDSPYLKLANKFRIPWTTEINLFLERCPAKVIGVTGTNGKETVVRMIEMVLRDQVESRNTKIWIGGNIGKSLLADLDRMGPSDVAILELSSFQLAWLPIIKYSPPIAVITNLTPDHLDWHKTMRAYTDAKANILKFQTKGDVAIVNWSDRRLRKLAQKIRGTLVKVSKPAKIKLAVPGQFNKLNAALAKAVARLFGVPLTTSHKLLTTFKGVPHALELVGTKNGVRYYNDSAATTPEATIAALAAFKSKVILIVGGYDKKLPFESLITVIKKRAKQVYTVGETGGQIHELLPGQSTHASTLDRAMELIKENVQRGEIVLLSPAAASYDQFNNLEERGEKFKQLVLQ